MRHSQVLFVVAALLVGGIATASRVRAQIPGAENAAGAQADRADTIITLRWGARPGVSRYRLQLAADASFTNIVFDRVVQGEEFTISDLAPGRYFWRVAPLTAALGAFSSVGVIDVAPKSTANPTPRTDAPAPSAGTTPEPATGIRAGGGWFAGVGIVARPILAHLRTSNSFDLVATIDDGRVVAIDAVNGRALWTVRSETFPAKQSPTIPLAVVVPTGNGLDNVILLGTTATMVDGRAGRVLGKTDLPGVMTRATASGDRIFALDSSLQKLFVLSAINGRVLADIRLPGPAVGEPTPVIRDGRNVVMIALDDGRIQIRDGSGRTILEGNAAAHAMTAPLVVRTPRGELVLVGTTGGLTALNADDLRPLGRVTLKGDQPRGTLVARDLDGDGIAEIVVFTDRGRVVIVKSDEGKIVFEADAKQADSAAFADVNGDGVLDLLMTGHEEFAFALSGRDGALIWKSVSPSGVATNHASLRYMRSPFVVPTASGVLLIAADSNGLRAVEFHKPGSTPR